MRTEWTDERARKGIAPGKEIKSHKTKTKPRMSDFERL